MTIESSILHLLTVVGKFIVAPIAVVGWWMFKRRDKEMHEQRTSVNKRIARLERRMAASEKETAVISSKLDNIREDNREIKESLTRLTDKLLK